VSVWLEAVRASGNSVPTLVICPRCHGNGYILGATTDTLKVQQCEECDSQGSLMFSMYDNPDNPENM